MSQNLQLAESLQRHGNGGAPGLLIGDIVVQAEASPGHQGECSGQALVIDVGDAHQRPFLGHADGALAPDPGGGSGDKRRLVAEPPGHSTVPAPSMTSSAPSTSRDSSLARKTMRWPTSSGCPVTPGGV